MDNVFTTKEYRETWDELVTSVEKSDTLSLLLDMTFDDGGPNATAANLKDFEFCILEANIKLIQQYRELQWLKGLYPNHPKFPG